MIYNSRSHSLFCLSLALMTLLGVETSATEPPFVAGFDRFGLHKEIPETTAGRLLLSELSCAACHSSSDPHLAPKKGPRLNGAGNRLSDNWVKAFLADPNAVKPGTTMPDVLSGLPREKKTKAINALSAYLSTQREPFPEIKAGGVDPVPFEFWNKGDVERGRNAFHQVGCVACHAPDPDYEVADIKPSPFDEQIAQLDAEDLAELGLTSAARRVNSIPLPDLAAKYNSRALTLFLLNPEKHRPAGRMPNLKLQAMEASDLAAYLIGRPSPVAAESKPDTQLVDEGRRLFRELRCVNCHSTQDKFKPLPPIKSLNKLDPAAEQNCYSKPQQDLPHYPLDDAQIAALKAAIEKSVTAEKIAAADDLHFQMLQLNCYACHEREQMGGVGRFRKAYFDTVGHIDLGDEGRLPPPLTGVGRKLQSGWLAKVLDGRGDIRPHMHIRMPRFPAAAVKPLPKLFAQADKAKPKKEQAVFGDLKGLAAAGRELMDVGCVQCHEFRGEALPGSVGVDLQGIAGRVDPGWFAEFLHDPGALKPRTRMPTFFPGGQSQNKELLDGDPDRQIAAMWAYLKGLDKLELPQKIVESHSQNFELIPQDRPIILRTFMNEAGTHAIAVGFPEQTHFAFDAEQIHPAVAWRGRFLDALGTWFVRFAPPAEPLGKQAIDLPPGRPFAILKDNQQLWPTPKSTEREYRFRGYRLDKTGTPTFLYRFHQLEITDRVTPDEKQGLRREITISPTAETTTTKIWFRALVGKDLKNASETAYSNQDGLTVTLPAKLAKRGELRTQNDVAEWLIPLETAAPITIEVNYSW